MIDNELPLVLQNYRRFLNTYTARILVHLLGSAFSTFELAVETTFGLRGIEAFGGGTAEETRLLIYTVSTDPQENYERFREFLSQQKEAGSLKTFASLRKGRGDFRVEVNPDNEHLLQVFSRKPGEEELVIDLSLTEERQEGSLTTDREVSPQTSLDLISSPSSVDGTANLEHVEMMRDAEKEH